MNRFIYFETTSIRYELRYWHSVYIGKLKYQIFSLARQPAEKNVVAPLVELLWTITFLLLYYYTPPRPPRWLVLHCSYFLSFRFNTTSYNSRSLLLVAPHQPSSRHDPLTALFTTKQQVNITTNSIYFRRCCVLTGSYFFMVVSYWYTS